MSELKNDKTAKAVSANGINDTTNNYVMGIGASAGGLEAINELFDNMPVNTGFAFVVIQHLSPEHKSLMGELLAKHTEMQVFEARDGMELKPNVVHLIPPGKVITVSNGVLKVEAKVRDHQPNTAIDIFFESLAADKGEKAIAVILSGTGTDGTKGIQAIKNGGGTVIVQDPAMAQFDGMPNSAVASGYADLILPAEMIPDELLDFIQEAPLLRSFNALSNQEEAVRLDILQLVYKTTGHDFSNYKRPTINRRMAKRMAECNIRTIADYYTYLLAHPEEVKKLCKEFLLHVTRFFRDEEVYEKLKDLVLPKLLSGKKPDDVVKVWAVACSTGEEAYSLAIIFDEYLEEHKLYNVDVKIFATDISQDVIDIASRGVYTEDQVKYVSPDRLKRYFVKEMNNYRITPNLRKMIVFAKHDILKDPPFGRIDLLTCRNMLIYMNPVLQKTVLQKFHFALNDDGYLCLGPSENISTLKDVMSEVDRKWKIYQCISKARMADYEPFASPRERQVQLPSTVAKSKNALNNLTEIFKETLLEEYDYAGIFIDKDFEVKQAIGNFRKFMDFPEGNFNFNLLKLVPTDLSIALSTGIRKAIKDNERIVQKRVKVADGKEERSITIIIKPYLVQKTYLQPFLFVILKEEEAIPQKVSTNNISKEEIVSQRVDELEQELLDTKENLQALLEEVESANEELQSSNEEIISSNEELQSTNEELQSLNEELHTVNAEHQLKIKELIELNDDLNNYFRNTEVGQVLIDRKLIIRKFTPAATKLVNLIATDIGRSIIDISTNIRNVDLVNEIKDVMQSQKIREKEVMVEDDRTYLMRIAPYLRQGKLVDGVVVNFIDVSEIKKLNTLLEAVFNSSTSGIVAMHAVRDEDDKITDFEFITANRAAHELSGLPENLTGKRLKELYAEVDSKVFDEYISVVETGKTGTVEVYNERSGKWFNIIAVKMMDGLVVTYADITERKKASDQIERGYEEIKNTSAKLQASNVQLEQSNMDLLQFASVASHDLKEPLRKVQAFGHLLKDKISTKLNDAETNYLDKMINSSNRMQVLIDDILTLSRLSKNDTPKSNVNLDNVVAQIVDDLEISLRDKNGVVEIGKLPTVKGIPGQIHQLFQNLISNAIKFNDKKPHIQVGVEEISPALEKEFDLKGSDYAGIYVQDNGIGFEVQYADKIFGIFQRLESSSYIGTGIGLAIVKKIIENHGGYIKAIGQPGKGARFIVLLRR